MSCFRTGLRDSRSKIFTSNNSEYTLLLSNITFDDEGLYKCLLYEDKVISKRFKVKVLGKYIYFITHLF